MEPRKDELNGQTDPFLAGGGEMGALMRAKDWSQTPLGPIETWSPTLRIMVSFLLANRFPLLLWWGPQYASIYNDAYRPILGTKHPKSIGQPVSECWREIWHILQPLIDTPYNGGSATWMEDILLEINRHGFVEEAHFTIAYSPVPDETASHGIGGVLTTVHEITEKVVAERRAAALRDLSVRMAEARTAVESCAIAAETLAKHAEDIPFALLYLIDPDTKQAQLAGAAGVSVGESVSPAVVELDEQLADPSGWPLVEMVRSEAMQVVEDLGSRFPAVPPGPWTDLPHTAVVVPIKSNIAHRLAGVFVAGVSPRLRLDDLYRNFFELLTTQIATAIANARAYEEERKHAAALAEIDRAKTAFLANISHEFRTPLTLMLEPLEAALADDPARLPQHWVEIDVAHRNALRLLKLVNSLLDFSHIEAGRMQTSYEPTDLAGLTAELASNFHSACKRADLKLRVDCRQLPELVYVDRDIWEKIVLNLLSNAFKFTFEGEIAVRLNAVNGAVELSVCDTGVGIPKHALPRLFERFYRIEGQRSRTHEGSGIGLSLVQELVILHSGTIRAESELDRGTSFTVCIPFGTAHLPAQRIGAKRTLTSAAVRAQTYVEEALHWLPDAPAHAGETLDGVDKPDGAPQQQCGSRIVLADDNADMRAYIRRLLGTHYTVETMANGQAALESIRAQRPDLVLADVMMPHLDGFGLLRAIRSDLELCSLPVIMLSARAGEEARVEGLDAGADDYLTKPFSGRELFTRVESNLKLAKVRQHATAELRESEVRFRALSETLERQVETRTTELRQQAAQLRRLAGKLTSVEQRERKRLAAILHDGLQQLLVAAKIRLGQANRQIRDPAALAAIETAVELIDQAVDASRNLAHQLRPPVLYEGGLIPALRWLASELSRLHELHIVIDVEATELTLDDDVKALLFESVRELLFNIVKHANVKQAAVYVRQGGQRLRITVEDNGAGFDVETVAQEENPQQLGLGLFSIRERLTALGGDTAIASIPGNGTRISLTIPVAPTQGKVAAARQFIPVAAPPKTTAGDRQRTRVLVVDDHAIVREGIANVLSGDERLVVVGEASDGVEAIEAVERYHPDVVLMDVNMPRMNGVEATREIHSRWLSVHIVALSIQDDMATMKTMIHAGASAFVSKSDAADQIIDVVLNSS